MAAPQLDFYTKFISSPAGSFISSKAGLPKPHILRRFSSTSDGFHGPIVIGGTGSLVAALPQLLEGYEIVNEENTSKKAGLVCDASGITRPEDLKALFEFFRPQIRTLTECARIVVIGLNPEETDSTDAHISQRSLEGFTRSLGKEMLKGGTVNLVYVDKASTTQPDSLASTVRFLLSAKSAYVSGQVFRVTAHTDNSVSDWSTPLAGKVAVVTGAARGIGASVAEVLARDGAHVICADIPAASQALAATAERVGGSAVEIDVTAEDAAEVFASHAAEHHGGKIDIFVHNAGITRDKTMAGMKEGHWDAVVAVNLLAPVRLTEQLVDKGVLSSGSRVIGVSSIAGIAGNRGQTNYGTTKAGVIGIVEAFSASLADNDITVNAVAPGFIETDMTAAIPAATREAGRRMNSMLQGGHPVDVAETISYFASPASSGVSGNVVRVCGQSLLGA